MSDFILDPESTRLAVQTATTYLNFILKKPAVALGDLLSEKIGQWRLMNRLRCLVTAKKFADESGIDPAKVLPNVFVPLIEEAGNTDDETLSDMFARLLATHLDAAEQSKAEPVHAKILAQMSPMDAKVLRSADEFDHKTIEGATQQMINGKLYMDPRPMITAGAINPPDGATVEAIQVSLENLERLGLLRLREPGYMESPHTFAFGYEVTGPGVRLLIACNDPKTYWRRSLPGSGAPVTQERPSAMERRIRKIESDMSQNMLGNV